MAPPATIATIPVSDFVTRQGTQLSLDGRPWRFTGINAPQAATDYDVNAGCGAQIDLNALFSSLRPNSAVRVGFAQDATVNAKTGLRDWRGLDAVVQSAERSPIHPRLIVSLASQSGTCDAEVWKGSSWYQGGYRQPMNNWDSLPRTSYWDYMHEVVTRYRNSAAIAIWEPVGEPEATDCAPGLTGARCYGTGVCPPAASTILRSFFDVIGAELKRIDPNHLMATAALGGGQCGWTGDGGKLITASPYIDVATYHDYGYDLTPVPADLQFRINEAHQLGKPIVSEEVGIRARDGMACGASTAARSSELQAKMVDGFAAGLAGFAPWAYGGPYPAVCDYYILPADPILGVL